MFPRHATDVISLVFGALFAGFTVVWLLTLTEAIGLDDARLAGPVALITAGAIGLAAALRPRRSGGQPGDDSVRATPAYEEPGEGRDEEPDEGRSLRL